MAELDELTTRTRKIVFYGKPGCGGNARQLRVLRAAGHEVEVRDLLSHSFSPAELRSFFGERPVHEWFNASSPLIKSGEVDPTAVNEEQALRLFAETPLLIRRPLMEIGDQRFVGFSPDALQPVLGQLEGSSSLDGCAHPATSCRPPA